MPYFRPQVTHRMFFQLVRPHTCWTVLIGGPPTRTQRKLCTATSKTFVVYFGFYSIYTFLFSTKYVFSKISTRFYKKVFVAFYKNNTLRKRPTFSRNFTWTLRPFQSMDLILLFYFFSEISKTLKRTSPQQQQHFSVSPLTFLHCSNHFMTFLY